MTCWFNPNLAGYIPQLVWFNPDVLPILVISYPFFWDQLVPKSLAGQIHVWCSLPGGFTEVEPRLHDGNGEFTTFFDLCCIINIHYILLYLAIPWSKIWLYPYYIWLYLYQKSGYTPIISGYTLIKHLAMPLLYLGYTPIKNLAIPLLYLAIP